MGISVEWHAIDPAGLARAWAVDLEVAAWTVTDPRVARRLEASGVAALCVEGRAFACGPLNRAARQGSRGVRRDPILGAVGAACRGSPDSGGWNG